MRLRWLQRREAELEARVSGLEFDLLGIHNSQQRLSALETKTSTLENKVAKVEAKLRVWSRPGPLNIVVTGERVVLLGEIAMKIMVFTVLLPKLTNKLDIVKRELQVLVDGTLSQTTNISDLDQNEVAGLEAVAGSTVTLELRDVDDAGLMSAPSIAEFVSTDTIPPPQPGALGAIITGERVIPDPEPVPEPDPEPVPEPAPEPVPEPAPPIE